ncbi:hematopoietic progenitor cell antigen CD34 isoform X1 [Acanthopagrus latus]|uniref:hematopoietic progenitor cell antigen CD34 isoform X1 n=1 Tax=Acanthopagrus latus TaxID=8177 RepID=UPI00187C716E|nr:hematopoietic progenitor cell antigen CD34 isoform X1 [Acanthopagrus latus]
MAASSARRTMDGPCKTLAFALLLVASLLSAGVMAQEEEVVTGPAPTVDVKANVRGDMIPMATEAPAEPEDPQVQVMDFPTPGPLQSTEQTTGIAIDEDDQQTAAPGDEGEGVEIKFEVQTDAPEKVAEETHAPMPARGDGPANVPRPMPKDDVVCVSKEAVQDKNAVKLKLKASSTCEDTKVKIESVQQELCGEDCKLEIFQEDNSDEILVSGKYVEDDVAGMANKFNNDNIKDKTDVMEAAPRWGNNSKLVLVSLLLTGLLLAALLVAGYYLKTHRKNSKGVRLAESYQVDEENQANTLVSVAPLPQEPLDKPTVNGESPPENGTNPAPTTNGHSATQTPVADTEM